MQIKPEQELPGKVGVEDLLCRGWSQDAIQCIAKKPHTLTATGEPAWEKSYILSREASRAFQNFTTAQAFYRNEAVFEERKEKNTRQGQLLHDSVVSGQSFINSLVNREQKNSGFSNLTIHWLNKDCLIKPQGSYTFFTDGSFKNIGARSWSCCSGWLLDNESGQPIMEFIKPIMVGESRPKEMPSFELMGIGQAVQLAKELGLHNVDFYTDSSSEAEVILAGMHDLLASRIDDHPDVYNEVIDFLKTRNGNIGWIPREYNSHADELGKVAINHWSDEYKTSKVAFDYIKTHGYECTPDREIFFHQEKLQHIVAPEIPSRWVLMVIQGHAKKPSICSILYNRDTDSHQIINEVKLHRKDPQPNSQLNKQQVMTGLLQQMCESIKSLHHLPDLSIYGNNEMSAILQHMTPIPVARQGEYFQFHQTCAEFPGKLFYLCDNSLLRKKLKSFKEIGTVPQIAKKSGMKLA